MSHTTQLHNRGSLDDYMQIMNSAPLPGNVQDQVYLSYALETLGSMVVRGKQQSDVGTALCQV